MSEETTAPGTAPIPDGWPDQFGTPVTRIVQDAPYVTVLAFLHIDSVGDQDAILEATIEAARRLGGAPGAVALNVLRSTDGSRVMTYQQWANTQAARVDDLSASVSDRIVDDHSAREYAIVYADDRSADGVSIISPAYRGAIFINEITTEPATQERLLELVIANNKIQSQHTPGYRSANFHKSRDGRRAVNYSLWDTQENCLTAISAMADMDANLEETIEIADPDFRFYTLAHSWHA